MQCVALDLAAGGMLFNTVNPGVAGTQVHRRRSMPAEGYEVFLEHLKTLQPRAASVERDVL